MTKLLIAGEAYGSEEAKQGRPFVGSSGWHLENLMSQAGLPHRNQCYITNVFNLQPRPTNDIKNLCGKKSEGVPGLKPLAGKYLLAEYLPELRRFWAEVKEYNPDLILALGNTPLWALVSGSHKISDVRGTVMPAHINHPETEGWKNPTPIKVLPTFHPAAMMREMKLRPIILADMKKAARELQFREIRRPNRTLWIEPQPQDLTRFYNTFIRHFADRPWGVDIETQGGTITEIGFSRPDIGIVVPFLRRPNKNYWPEHNQEVFAWNWVKQVLAELKYPVFQNGLYDINYLWRTVGITVPRAGEDTMLLHHALQPEMKKGLGFLGSIYTDEPSWKMMRDKSGDQLKKED